VRTLKSIKAKRYLRDYFLSIIAFFAQNSPRILQSYCIFQGNLPKTDSNMARNQIVVVSIVSIQLLGAALAANDGVGVKPLLVSNENRFQCNVEYTLSNIEQLTCFVEYVTTNMLIPFFLKLITNL
jgi:hypothetical protein